MRTTSNGRNWGDATHSWAELHELPESTPIGAVIAVEPSIEIPTEMPRDPPPLETPTPTPRPPRYNGFAHDNFDSEISLRDVVGEPLVHNKVCCPFHDDATPSCHVYADHFHCFACGAHGDAISWLMEVEGLSFTGAQDALACWEPHQRSTAEIEDNINQGRTAFVTGGILVLRGGMPIRVNGAVVGAVGVAGLSKEIDAEIANTAAAALSPSPMTAQRR
jgi:hypothetical protein